MKVCYGYLESEDDRDLLRWVVRHGSGCFWMLGAPRTSVRAFEHRLMTKAVQREWVPIASTARVWNGSKRRFRRMSTELRKGSILRGSPAFPTKASPDHKAIERGRRLVVDYRAFNRVTQRRRSIIPSADVIKIAVAELKFVSVADLKEDFKQVENEPETAATMAVLTGSGCDWPAG